MDLKKKIFSGCLILATIVLFGCTSKLGTPVLFKTPQNTPILTQPNFHLTATLRIKPTPTTTPSIGFQQQCLDINTKEKSLKNVALGVVSLYNLSLNTHSDLLDIQTGREYRIPSEQTGNYGGGGISPNGMMYAYREEITSDDGKTIRSILSIVDAHAGLLSKMTFNHYIGAPRWLSNDQIVLYIDETDDAGSVMVVHPFANEEHIITNELPMLYTYNGINRPTWRAEYSPDLEWVAYINIDGTIVRNVVTKQTIWQATGGTVSKPAWSMDGQQVAIANAEDGQLYLIKRSGQAQAILPDGIEKDASSPSWSPDGQFIAFLNKDDMMIYSRRENKVIDLCFQGRWNMFNNFDPVWSPDSQQLFVPSEGLVDLQKRVAYKAQEITDNEILYWMRSLP